MKHLDLFSGIGGFALAADRVWPGIEHTFVEYDPFCQAVLKKHYPNSTIHGDIRQFIADTEREGRERQLWFTEGQHRLCGGGWADEDPQIRLATDTINSGQGGAERESTTASNSIQEEYRTQDSTSREFERADSDWETARPYILTGGFPCQPFSHAGRRKGTDDDRYLWPEMFRVIQLYRPTWVIAENVRGLVTWNEGMVLETVCADLEGEGYEVQPLIIPACSVGAPHRRDRVWIVAHSNSGKQRAGLGSIQKANGEVSERDDNAKSSDTNFYNATNPGQQLREQGSGEGVEADTPERSTRSKADKREHKYTWADDWREVALATCHDSLDDGLPRQMGGITISASRHRKEQLKAYGNAIVPQVAEQIMRAISC